MLANFTEDKDLGQIRVIASDMDCTLLADDGSMPPHMDALIRKLDAAGITFCAASGRPNYTLAEMFPENPEPDGADVGQWRGHLLPRQAHL